MKEQVGKNTVKEKLGKSVYKEQVEGKSAGKSEMGKIKR